MSHHAAVPQGLALLRPPSLDALAAGHVRHPVTAANAEMALNELARHMARDGSRWAGVVLPKGNDCGKMPTTTERADAAGTCNANGALGSPPEEAGGKHV